MAISSGQAAVTVAAALGALVAGSLTGCAEVAPPRAESSSTAAAAPPPVSQPPSTSAAPRVSPSARATVAGAPRMAAPARPVRLRLSIPAIGLERLRVVPYRGTADDRPGTHIQDTGRAASPRGPAGGTKAGAVGNFIVTAHRTTAGRPFGRLPELRPGQHILVTAGDTVYDYRVTRTLRVSFRDPASRASQSAPVPGRPGVQATRPMITLSTCATPEDHAAGNFWADALGNPEHRIDKVGVLVDVRSVSS